MAGLSNEVFNNSERGVADDMNAMQSLIGRDLMDLFRFMSMTPTGGVRNVVLGGLVASPSGSDVAISVGALMQDSATLAPAPGALDSTYRLGVLRTPATVVMPAPGATTYYLIEAQMVEATTTESRDIYTPPSTWTPTNVPKQRIRGIQFQLLTGGANAPTPTGGDWVPIAVVRRPGGGGPVATTDIFDVRPEVDLAPRPFRPVLSGAQRFIPGTNFHEGTCHARGSLGTRFWSDTGGIDLNTAEFLSTGLVLAADTWYYLYLAPWGPTGLTPGASIYGSRGVLVLSSVAPSSSTRMNNAVIAAPAPWNGSGNIPSQTAYCIGAVRRNSGNTGWVGAFTEDGCNWTTEYIQGPAPAWVAPTTDVNFTGFIPGGVTLAKVGAVMELAGGSTTTAYGYGDTAGVNFSATMIARTSTFQTVEFDFPTAALGSTVRYTVFSGTVAGGSFVNSYVKGWRW